MSEQQCLFLYSNVGYITIESSEMWSALETHVRDVSDEERENRLLDVVGMITKAMYDLSRYNLCVRKLTQQ